MTLIKHVIHWSFPGGGDGDPPGLPQPVMEVAFCRLDDERWYEKCFWILPLSEQKVIVVDIAPSTWIFLPENQNQSQQLQLKQFNTGKYCGRWMKLGCFDVIPSPMSSLFGIISSTTSVYLPKSPLGGSQRIWTWLAVVPDGICECSLVRWGLQ